MAYNPYYQLAKASRDLSKYLVPGAGARLARADERKMGIDGRLPEHYLRYHRQWKKQPMKWIHTKPCQAKFEKNEFGEVVRVQNFNIPVVYPEEFHMGLWGGEGIVRGFLEPPPSKHKPNYKWPEVKYWFPKLHETVVYSEVLDKHIAMTATQRGEYLVHKHRGFDSYLLETPVNEVYAIILLKIKREILLSLVRETLCPNDAVKRKELLDKYREFILPEEEADWHGLPIGEARTKQLYLDQMAREQDQRPKKEAYRKELVSMLHDGYLSDMDPSLLYDKAPQEGMTVAGAWKWIKKKMG